MIRPILPSVTPETHQYPFEVKRGGDHKVPLWFIRGPAFFKMACGGTREEANTICAGLNAAAREISRMAKIAAGVPADEAKNETPAPPTGTKRGWDDI